MSINKFKYPNDSQQTMWLSQIKQGNQLAFNHIVEKYQPSIYNLCYRMLKNAAEAEDAAQEVFTRAYFKLDSYNDRDKFSTWLFAIASHYCIDILRKRRFQVIPWDDLASWHRCSSQETSLPETVLIEAEASEEIQALLNQLPSEYRKAVILKYWQAMSYQEIAEILKTTVGAVKSKLFRARRMLATSVVTIQMTGTFT